MDPLFKQWLVILSTNIIIIHFKEHFPRCFFLLVQYTPKNTHNKCVKWQYTDKVLFMQAIYFNIACMFLHFSIYITILELKSIGFCYIVSNVGELPSPHSYFNYIPQKQQCER